MSNDLDDPRLPPELEREIFSLSLRQNRADAKHLFLVAKRVYDWLIPIYYEVVVTTPGDDCWPPKVGKNDLERYGQHARHFHALNRSLVELLKYCPNVWNLAIWINFGNNNVDLDIILHLPITHLSIEIQSIFSTAPQWLTFFSRITHLDICTREEWNPEEILPSLPILTHLAMFFEDEGDVSGSCLNYGKMLQTMVLMGELYDPADGKLHVEEREGIDDLRVVCIRFGRSYEKDWTDGAWGGEDMWVFADTVVAERIALLS